MKYKLYQINEDRDSEHRCFLGLEYITNKGLSPLVDPSIYDQVYSGEAAGTLEDLFRTFNVAHPHDFQGHSMSVSDVVVVEGADGLPDGAYFCDSVGFKPVDFPICEVPPKKETMTVVMLHSGKPAVIAEIGRSLKDLQAAVGGTVEQYSPFEDPVSLLCNEEGKILGLPLNRAIYDEGGGVLDIIAGPCFICGHGTENFDSLSPAMQQMPGMRICPWRNFRGLCWLPWARPGNRRKPKRPNRMVSPSMWPPICPTAKNPLGPS